MRKTTGDPEQTDAEFGRAIKDKRENEDARCEQKRKHGVSDKEEDLSD